MQKITIDVAIPALAQTLQLLVPEEMLAGYLLEAVEDIVDQRFQLSRRANLYFAEEGLMMDYDMPIKRLARGTKLILM